jgi:O-antigen/teichoic acid export membrane protein
MLNRLIGFLLLPLFTHHLTPEDYGVAAVLQIVSLLATPVFSLGLGAAMAPCYFKESDPAARRAVVGTSFFISLISVAVLTLLAFLFARPLTGAILDTPERSDLFLLAILTVVTSILTQPFTLALQFEERAKLYIVLSVSGTLLTAVLNILAVVGLRMGLQGWLAATLAGQVLQGLGFALAIMARGAIPVRKRLVRLLLLQGLPMVPSFAFLYVLQQGNRYFMEMLHGLGTLGIYTVGMSLGMVMSLFTTAFQNAWLPYFMRFVDKPRDEAEAIFGRVTSYYFLGFGSLTLCFFIFARPVVELMANPRFRDAIWVVGPVALAYLLQGAGTLLTPPQYFGNRLEHITLLQGIAAGISVLINWVFITRWGLMGGGLALALSHANLLVLHYLWNCLGKSHPLRIRYEWRRLAGFGLVFAAFASYFMFGPCFGPALACLQGITAVVLLGGALWMLISSEDRAKARVLLGKLPGVHRKLPQS